MQGLSTYCLFSSLLGGCLCQLQVWASCSDFSDAGAPEGKETWPSAQQPVLYWVPRTTSSGHLITVSVPRMGAALRASWRCQPQGRLESEFWQSGWGPDGRAQILGVMGTPRTSDPGWPLKKACPLLGLQGPGGLGRMKNEEGILGKKHAGGERAEPV